MKNNIVNCYCYFSLHKYKFFFILPGIGEEDRAQNESWAAPVNSHLEIRYLLPNPLLIDKYKFSCFFNNADNIDFELS